MPICGTPNLNLIASKMKITIKMLLSRLPDEEIRLAVERVLESRKQPGSARVVVNLKMILQREWRIGVLSGNCSVVFLPGLRHRNRLPNLGLINTAKPQVETGNR